MEDDSQHESDEVTKAALGRVRDLAAEYAGQTGRLKFYGTPTVEALRELRAETPELDYRALLADVEPVATVDLEKVHRSHVDAVDVVRRVHGSYEYVITVVEPDDGEAVVDAEGATDLAEGADGEGADVDPGGRSANEE
ncbi:MAG: hypothetical protein ABEJ74_02055 [Haloferacaceae archaeon]